MILLAVTCCGNCAHWEVDGPSRLRGYCDVQDDRTAIFDVCEEHEEGE